ncbi:MAG: carbohydrate ABC transporter permease [Dehalococcoidia bacterium]|nr:MAG: carbohydrate ABC transporter permease [Dehalococcoidia bacterium]
MANVTPSFEPDKTRLRQLRLTGWIGEILKYSILILLAITYVMPFFWMVTSALKNDAQVYVVPPKWIPNPAFWSNFYNAWQSQPFNLYVFNTVVRYAIPSTLGVVLSSSIVAYGFSRLKWPGRDNLFYLCLATMMVPFQVQMVPLFMIFKRFDWLNSFLPLVVPAYFGSPFFIFMLRQFFMTIPAELSDAARIDGANEFDILFRVILPLCKPALTVVGLFSFIGAWNDYLGPLIYVHDQEKYVLALGVENMRRAFSFNSTLSNTYPYLMAVSTIVVLPILIMFFFGQRMFIEGISLTGLKE